MKRFPVGAAVLIIAIITSIIACSNDGDPYFNAPFITYLTPDNGSVGDEITITGINFGSARETSTVAFNGTEATEYAKWNDFEIKVKIPAGATSGKLFVTANGHKSNKWDFTINTATLFGEYKSVKIGNQVWMTSNLSVDHYRNGDPIPEVTDWNEWSDLTSGAWCYYENDYGNGTKLYNWYAVNDPRGLAPEGWHIPSDNEWTTLTDYLGGPGVAGGKLKDKWSGLWYPPNTGATDEVTFTALPGGSCDEGGSFGNIRYNGYWWTSTGVDNAGAYFRRMAYDDALVHESIDYKKNGFSVRCVAD